MKIFGYIIANPDEIDVLPDALDSLATFSDHIYLTDGGLGGGTLCNHPRYTTPLHDVLYEWVSVCQLFTHGNSDDIEEYTGIWNRTPLTLWERPFDNPASQRNWTLNRISKEIEQPDWIVMLDADEVYSLEAETGMRRYLEQLSSDVIGVYQKWLNLAQDEQHCLGGHHSDWLAHPRIMRPGTFYFDGSWHEAMICDRGKLVRWDTRVVHDRSMFRKRLLVQRNHATIVERSKIAPEKPPFHADAWLEDVPKGVTWRPLRWPSDELPIPFSQDALEVWDEYGNKRRVS